MSTAPFNQNAYGLSQALINVFPQPITANRAPLSTDKAQIGTLWIYGSTNSAYVITSIVNNSANWQNLSGGSGSFTNLTVNGTSTLNGNVSITGASTLTMGTGLVSVGTGGISSTGGINVSSGGISVGTISGGFITATTGNIAANQTTNGLGLLVAAGTPATLAPVGSGKVGYGGATTTGSAGATYTVKGVSSATPINSSGFLDIIVNNVVYYIPFFASN